MTARMREVELSEGSAQTHALSGVAYESRAVPVAPGARAQGEYHTALTALVRLYRSAYDKGNVDLALRAEQAVGALMGGRQKHLRTDSDAPPRFDGEDRTFAGLGDDHTLCGLGPAFKR